MLRMLQDFLPLFQRFPISPKTPCNMTATYVLVVDVGAYYGVSRSYIFRCLKEIAPERRRQMVQSIIVLCFWPEMMARMQILTGRID